MRNFAQIAGALGRGGSGGQPAKVAVMIVDDNPMVAESLRHVLSGSYQVVACSSYAEVKERLTADVRVVLLDVKMTPVDGLTMFALLRDLRPDLRIVFNTAYPGGSDVVTKLKELRPDGMLWKGEYSADDLEQFLARVLESPAQECVSR